MVDTRAYMVAECEAGEDGRWKSAAEAMELLANFERWEGAAIRIYYLLLTTYYFERWEGCNLNLLLTIHYLLPWCLSTKGRPLLLNLTKLRSLKLLPLST